MACLGRRYGEHGPYDADSQGSPAIFGGRYHRTAALLSQQSTVHSSARRRDIPRTHAGGGKRGPSVLLCTTGRLSTRFNSLTGPWYVRLHTNANVVSSVATQPGPGRKVWNELAAAERPVTWGALRLGMCHSSCVKTVSIQNWAFVMSP